MYVSTALAWLVAVHHLANQFDPLLLGVWQVLKRGTVCLSYELLLTSIMGLVQLVIGRGHIDTLACGRKAAFFALSVPGRWGPDLLL